ncbi:hypothetical protein CNR22_21870 [Sphingobacteriaceae bacterium]|nr:hypothetical protein CNR22_21870 [Sphingobacteriaceae bacterium]
MSSISFFNLILISIKDKADGREMEKNKDNVVPILANLYAVFVLSFFTIIGYFRSWNLIDIFDALFGFTVFWFSLSVFIYQRKNKAQ